MDPIGAGGQRASAKGRVVVLADGEDRPPGCPCRGDRSDPVVAPGGQVDDHAIRAIQGRLEAGRRADRDGLRARTADEVGQTGGPDEVVREDGDARDQPSTSAR